MAPARSWRVAQAGGGGSRPDCPLAGRHPSHAPATRNSPNRRDRAGDLGLDGDNRADETVASCEPGSACDRAADHRLAAKSPPFTNLLRLSPGWGAWPSTRATEPMTPTLSPTIVWVRPSAGRSRYAQQLRPTRLEAGAVGPIPSGGSCTDAARRAHGGANPSGAATQMPPGHSAPSVPGPPWDTMTNR